MPQVQKRSPVVTADIALAIALVIGYQYIYRGISYPKYTQDCADRAELLSGEELAWFIEHDSVEEMALLKQEVARLLSAPRDLALDMAVSYFADAVKKVIAARLVLYDDVLFRITQALHRGRKATSI